MLLQLDEQTTVKYKKWLQDFFLENAYDRVNIVKAITIN